MATLIPAEPSLCCAKRVFAAINAGHRRPSVMAVDLVLRQIWLVPYKVPQFRQGEKSITPVRM